MYIKNINENVTTPLTPILNYENIEAFQNIQKALCVDARLIWNEVLREASAITMNLIEIAGIML